MPYVIVKTQKYLSIPIVMHFEDYTMAKAHYDDLIRKCYTESKVFMYEANGIMGSLITYQSIGGNESETNIVSVYAGNTLPHES